jgi:hypothetical protein
MSNVKESNFSNYFANNSIPISKISNFGASNGQVLKFVDGNIIWSNDLTGNNTLADGSVALSKLENGGQNNSVIIYDHTNGKRWRVINDIINEDMIDY